MQNKRFYNFQLILYPEDINFNSQLDTLKQYDHIYILHDNDLNEDTNEYKKAHIHFIVRFKNARTINALSKESGVVANNIEAIKSMTGSLKYLIHYKNDNKFQYDIKNCISNCNLLDRLKKLVNDDIPEDQKALNLFEFIDNTAGYIEFKSFFVYVCKSGQYSVYRRNTFTFMKLIEDHNYEVSRKNAT